MEGVQVRHGMSVGRHWGGGGGRQDSKAGSRERARGRSLLARGTWHIAAASDRGGVHMASGGQCRVVNPAGGGVGHPGVQICTPYAAAVGRGDVGAGMQAGRGLSGTRYTIPTPAPHLLPPVFRLARAWLTPPPSLV